jgi:trimethylamine--corrinoid protein Co-methyltransferase
MMESETTSGARISPIQIKPEMRIKTMADEDVEKIHQATLTVLEQTGVKFPSEKALHIFAEGGANVGFKQQIVRIPSESPLNQGEGVLDAALVFAEAGLPVGFATMPVLGSTAPASIAGTMVLGNAEILSAICLIQLAYPGAPVTYPLFSGMMNPFSGACSVSTDNQYLFYGGTVQLGHYYNLPVMSTFGGSDCSDPGGWQVGRDDSIDAFYICATGPDMLPCLGAMEAYTFFYPEKLLFDDEIHQALLQMASGIQVNSETLALDEIMAVGPGGHFLDRDYTIKNFRKLWHPGISNLWSAEDQGFRDPQEAALDKTKWILKNHMPKSIGETAADELKRIIKTAENELVKS